MYAALPTPHARPLVSSLRSSKIREVANLGMGMKNVLPFWFGEPDEPTPEFIREAAIQALREGQTFYVQTHGLPQLRTSLATYLSGLHATDISAQRIAIASSGTSALMIAIQAVVGPGDHVVAVTPLWPNLVEMPKLLGATVQTVGLVYEGGWALDIQQLLDALKPGTRALLVNSPNNPTGWALTREQQQIILDHCRKHGIWIIADDVYERLYFDTRCAPSFLQIADENDLLISCNSFSKAWRMTGWRLGWMVAPASLHEDIGKLIEYNITCAPTFTQYAAVAAIEHGEDEISRSQQRFKIARDRLIAGLQTLPGVQVPTPPAGAMYLLFSVPGANNSLEFCKHLLVTEGLGLAPGIAFGESAEGYLRWCFASSLERIDQGVERLAKALGRP
ncbi:MAG: pyridoxal phosphate-dependent aminotransferase [Burkholderiaceae bacterium]|nr:pyridoxal phosphate-dependent aminotransferase [Burkholderiaceae bacterium]